MTLDGQRAAAGPAVTGPTRTTARAVAGRMPWPAVDVLLALGLAAFGLAEAWPGYVPIPERWGRVDWIAYLTPVVLTATGTLPLLWRRRFPVAVLGIVALSMAGWQLIGQETSATFFALFVAVFSAGLYARERRRSALALFVFFALFLAIWLVTVVLPSGVVDAWFLFMFVFIGSIWLTGDLIRARTVQAAELEERARRLERERALAAEAAAAEERTRIARELHDLVAHSMSVVVVQAAAALRVLDDHPDQARDAMRQVEATGRAAMTEMRRLLGMLRKDERERLTGPQPGVARLDELVADVRGAGLDVSLDVRGEQRALPGGIDVSVYRIVQEALTNTIRHARARRVWVTLDYRPDAINVSIVDDGVGGAAGGDAIGHGLVGMRERAVLLGGDFVARPRAEGGFEVRARLPAGSQLHEAGDAT